MSDVVAPENADLPVSISKSTSEWFGWSNGCGTCRNRSRVIKLELPPWATETDHRAAVIEALLLGSNAICGRPISTSRRRRPTSLGWSRSAAARRRLLSRRKDRHSSARRVDPRLPLSPGRAERHGFEYKRHGMLSLYAALNTRTGEVLGQTTARHTSADFLAFLREVVASQPRTVRFTSFSTISPRTKRSRSERSSRSIAGSSCTSHPPTRPGSIRSNSGSPRSSATSSCVASSPRSRI